MIDHKDSERKSRKERIKLRREPKYIKKKAEKKQYM
jgi:hypothetical protein